MQTRTIFNLFVSHINSFYTFAIRFKNGLKEYKKTHIMYAIVNIAGQQIKISENQPVIVHRLPAEEGAVVSFDQVIMVDNDGKIKNGNPLISGASVSAKVISHLKGDKVIVFKKKRRKGYQKSNGHRQQFTKIQIESIKI
jgi:large subunit ribosomal protein L21